MLNSQLGSQARNLGEACRHHPPTCDAAMGAKCRVRSPLCSMVDRVIELVWAQLTPHLPRSVISEDAKLEGHEIQVSESAKAGHIVDVHEDVYNYKHLKLRVWVPLEPRMLCQPFVLSAAMQSGVLPLCSGSRCRF